MPARGVVVLLAACAFHWPVASAAAEPPTLQQRLQDAVAFAGSNLIATANAANVTDTDFPCYAEPGQDWETRGPADWGSGMFPGSFWTLAKLTGDTQYATFGQLWSVKVDATAAGPAWDACKTWYDYNGDPAARNVVIAAAQLQTSTYVPLPDANGQNPGSRGVFTATGWRPDHYRAPTWAATYVDQMLFMQVGLWTASQTDDSDMYDKCILAARTSHDLLSRPDGGTHHWAYINTTTGSCITTQYQGYNDSTTWARGQAWMIHGMADVALCARQAGDPPTTDEFRGYAESAADYWLDNPALPADGIPIWDFNAGSTVPSHLDRDTSAAAIAASGFIDLSRLETDPDLKARYLDAAELILTSLSTPNDQAGYLNQNPDGSSAGNGILTHGVYVHSYSKATGNSGQFSKSVVDNAATIWGDYYFLEAIAKYEAVVPEPASISLLAVGGLAILRRRGRRRAQKSRRRGRTWVPRLRCG